MLYWTSGQCSAMGRVVPLPNTRRMGWGLLPVACCLLPVACCPLPAACCLSHRFDSAELRAALVQAGQGRASPLFDGDITRWSLGTVTGSSEARYASIAVRVAFRRRFGAIALSKVSSPVCQV